MELFGVVFNIGNRLGYYAFASIALLLLLYFVRPKPFKKVIPSLIFLESSEKKLSINYFFKKFVKDWLIILQFFLLLMLCFAALDLSAQMMVKRFNREVIFVIDASASSKADTGRGTAFEQYIDHAKKNIGLSSTIILAKDNPEVITRGANPINAFAQLNSLKPTSSLSNIWDAMMVAGDIGEPKSTIKVLSDMHDTGRKDLDVAKGILEAKGFRVEMMPPSGESFNIGIIRYTIEDEDAIIHVKNYDQYPRKITYMGEDILIEQNTIKQLDYDLKEGKNKIDIITGDSFPEDDSITIILPKDSGLRMLYVSNEDESFARSAFESMGFLKKDYAEPPIIPLSNQDIFVLDRADYDAILPGTIDSMMEKVDQGKSLIIIAQPGMDFSKLEGIIPVDITEGLEQDTAIFNKESFDRLTDYDFGMSSYYYPGKLNSNSTMIVAEADDQLNTPVITFTRYGKGNIIYYGIIDDTNNFRLSTQYPLFWLNMIDIMTGKDSISEVNLKVGDIIQGDRITDPEGRHHDEYIRAEHIGIYKVDDKEISVNLLDNIESEITKDEGSSEGDDNTYQDIKVGQDISLLPLFIILAIILALAETYALKKRGDV